MKKYLSLRELKLTVYETTDLLSSLHGDSRGCGM